MPTVLRIGAARSSSAARRASSLRTSTWSREQAGALARFWLDLVALAASSRFSGHELRRLEKQVVEHRQQFLEAWRRFEPHWRMRFSGRERLADEGGGRCTS